MLSFVFFGPIESQIANFLKDRIPVVGPSCMYEKEIIPAFLDSDVSQVSSQFSIAELGKLKSDVYRFFSLKINSSTEVPELSASKDLPLVFSISTFDNLVRHMKSGISPFL